MPTPPGRSPAPWRLLLGLGVLSLGGVAAGCGEDVLPSAAPLDGGVTPTCVDEDGDGFGMHCPSGQDCDDADPASTNECYRCNTPNTGCPCATEGQTVPCGELTSQVGDQIRCTKGERVCRAGVWGSCSNTGLETKSLAPPAYGGEAIAAVPILCTNNPCDPLCRRFDKAGSTPSTGGAATPDGTGGITLNPQGASGGPTCTPQNVSVPRRVLGFNVLLDRTSSMNSGTPTKLASARSGLQGFFSAAGVTGAHVRIDYFPKGTSGSFCNSATYGAASPGPAAVAWGVLPGHYGAFNTSLTGVTVASGDNATYYAALNRSLFDASVWATGGSNRKAAVILLADSLPSDCGTCWGKDKKDDKSKRSCALGELSTLIESYYYSTPSVETYVIALQSFSPSNGDARYLNTLARAGSGGVRDATIVAAGSGAATAVTSALWAFASHMQSCEFQVPTPPPGAIVDTSTVALTYNTSTPVTKRNSLGACGTNEGFYYDAVRNRVTLCPTSCTTAKQNVGAPLNMSYQCRSGCSGGSAQTTPDPIDMFIMMDRSGSMNVSVAGTGVTRWQAAQNAIRNFVLSPDSAGMGVGIAFYPLPTACNLCRYCTGGWFFGCLGWSDSVYPFCDSSWGSSCGATAPTGAGPLPPAVGNKRYWRGDNATCASSSYQDFSLTKGVALADLPANAANVYNAIERIVPSGGTPTAPALRGAIDYAISARASRGRKTVVVLVTDGNPNTCPPSGTPPQTQSVNEASYGYTQGIETHVIGIDTGDGSFTANLNAIQNAGTGGRFPSALIVNANDPNADPSALVNFFNTVRTRALGCSYNISVPSTGTLNYAASQVIVTHGTPVQETVLTQVANAAACTATGWYYDNPSAPTEVRLCTTPCSLLQNDPNARVDLVYQCQDSYSSTGTAVFEYDVSSMCPVGFFPRWNDFSWQATTPGNSRVTFQVATGDINAGVPSGVSSDVTLQFTKPGLTGLPLCAAQPTVCVTPDSRSGGPAYGGARGDAVVDSSLAAAGLARHRKYLRVTATLHPKTDATAPPPTLTGWDLEATCYPAE